MHTLLLCPVSLSSKRSPRIACLVPRTDLHELAIARVPKVPGSKILLLLLFPLSVLTWNVHPPSFFAPPPTTKTPHCLLTWETLCSVRQSFWVLAKCPLVSEHHFLSSYSLLPASDPVCSVRSAYCTPSTVEDITLSPVLNSRYPWNLSQACRL